VTADAALAGWTRGEFAAEGITHSTLRRGSGPGVIVVHEVPGITPTVVRFAEDVVDAGFTVVMPLLVGGVGRPPSPRYIASSFAKVCISREFTTLATGRSSPVVAWLRALARDVHASCGGPGVGAVGMCFSGGFALGMMLDDATVAPVLSQPSLPFAIGRRRGADLGLDADEAARVARRAAAGCSVLGLRFDRDRRVGDRFATLRRLLGDAFVGVEYPSAAASDHSVLTEQRRDDAVRRVVAFLRERLGAAGH
jgi:dienelactone hydrolase